MNFNMIARARRRPDTVTWYRSSRPSLLLRNHRNLGKREVVGNLERRRLQEQCPGLQVGTCPSHQFMIHDDVGVGVQSRQRLAAVEVVVYETSCGR